MRLYARPEDISSARELIKERIDHLAGKKHPCLHDSQPQSSVTHPDLPSQIHILPCPTNHCWVRDTGPVFVRPAAAAAAAATPQAPSSRFAIDFSFCEWGNKHLLDPDHPNPASDFHAWPIPSPGTVAENTGFAARVIASFSPPDPVARVRARVRLEGGGIEVDGQGTFFATESSILCAARNPGLTRAAAEEDLRRLLGVDRFIWFPGRRGLDVTDAHVDALVRVVRPGVVVVSRPSGYAAPPSGSRRSSSTRVRNEWMAVYDEVRAILARETDARGRRFEVHELEEPDPGYVTREEGEEDPAASYANFYFVNGAVVVPAFGDPRADERAVATMRRLVPEREVRTVRVNCLPRMGGVLHCVTQQVPAF